MTRKDYIAITRALRSWIEGDEPNTAEEHIANVLADDNPYFDREHFLAVVRGERELASRLGNLAQRQVRQSAEGRGL